MSVRLPATSPCQSAVAMGNASHCRHETQTVGHTAGGAGQKARLSIPTIGPDGVGLIFWLLS